MADPTCPAFLPVQPVNTRQLGLHAGTNLVYALTAIMLEAVGLAPSRRVSFPACLQTSTTTVSLPVPPTAVDDIFLQPASGPTTIPKSGILANDTVPCGNTATIRVISDPTSGSVVVKNDGSFVYTPVGTPAPDKFTYEVDCNGYVSVDISGWKVR